MNCTCCSAIHRVCSPAPQTNTFQGIVTTDHMRSFAVFTYKCGDIGYSISATIGFTAGDVLFANHPLTVRKRAKRIACINSPESQWVNVIFELTSEDLQPPDITGKQKKLIICGCGHLEIIHVQVYYGIWCSLRVV